MRKTIFTVLSAAALSLGAAGGTALLTASPAQADTAACIDTLLYYGAENTVGNVVCQLTEAAGDTAVPGYAGLPCNVAMNVVVGLPPEQAEEACAAAVAPTD
ncbi:hypothetical protein [Amycolatopsis nigrescens]|uniref:hypothetical protein n=1 Tax=Amycolatopsis nigrescens TaxID=381445 RepID=UPI000363E925|nr:hypothetical protein [Amycolatopsis nigrescens]